MLSAPLLDHQAILTESKKNALVASLEKMVKKADAAYEVTVSMLKRNTKTKASKRTIRRVLRDKNILFRKLKEKPDLTAEDVRERKKFADKHAGKTTAWWYRSVDMHIDVKHFAVYLDGKSRRHAAQVGCRGAYRSLNQRFAKGFVKPSTKLKYNSGARGIKVLAGVGGNGKVILWHYIEDRWNGNAAAEAYKGPALQALKKHYPAKRSYSVLEDNDPAGFKSSKGLAAKRASKISVFEIPKRSPDLNVCDYALWKEVNRRMRSQEQKCPVSKREAREEFLARLRRTALRLPATFVRKAIGDMKPRCERLQEANGWHIREGGA